MLRRFETLPSGLTYTILKQKEKKQKRREQKKKITVCVIGAQSHDSRFF
jgi:hypothetical protein